MSATFGKDNSKLDQYSDHSEHAFRAEGLTKSMTHVSVSVNLVLNRNPFRQWNADISLLRSFI